MKANLATIPAAVLLGISLLFANERSGFTSLSGTSTGHLDRYGSPYIVSDTLSVPAGSELVIDAGSVILFKNFAGIVVHGKLTVNGTQARPVIFTSENDSSVNHASTTDAAPFDWDGITLAAESGPSQIRNCSIRYSLYGINCVNENYRIDSLSFHQNGKSDVVLAGVGKVISQSPWSQSGITASPPPPITTSPPAVVAVHDTIPKPAAAFDTGTAAADSLRKATEKAAKELKIDVAKPSQNHRSKIAFRVISGAVTLGGLGFTALEYSKYSKADKHFWDVNDTSNKANHYTADDWKQAKNDRNQSMAKLITGGVISLVGALGFTFSFVF